MKAISVKQPFASWLLDGTKHSEHRTWATKFRGEVAIHASQKPDDEFMFEWGINKDHFLYGAIIGVLEIYDCVDLGNGIFAWKVRNPRIIPPIPAKGALSFWDVEQGIIDKILGDLKGGTNE